VSNDNEKNPKFHNLLDMKRVYTHNVPVSSLAPNYCKFSSNSFGRYPVDRSRREALALQAKTPILYTSVALRNWHAWQKLGIGGGVAPGSYHTIAMLEAAVEHGIPRRPRIDVGIMISKFQAAGVLN
jgi:hypothetical protein